MKLIIQIPCYNEEKSLPVALAALPRNVAGFDTVEWLIVDDGSSDRTVDVAQKNGVDHIIRLPKHQGLAKGYMAGLEACLQAGADVIVNTDADNQYCASDIPVLTAPILKGIAQIVIGARPIRLGIWILLVGFGSFLLWAAFAPLDEGVPVRVP